MENATKKRVLMLIGNELCIAGVPNVIMNIVDQLSGVYTFDILAFSTEPGALDDRFLSYGGKIYTLDIPRYPNHPIGCFSAYQILYAKLKHLFRENHYHVIHGHSGYYDGICLLAAEKANIPIRISHAHAKYTWCGRNFLVKYYLDLGKRMICKHATQSLACSDIAGNTLFLNQPYTNVLNPVDIAYYENIIPKPHREIRLLQIGYFSGVKNQLFSIKLVSYLQKKGVDAKLSLIGYPSDEMYFEKMNRLIEEENVSEHITFLQRDFDKRVAFAETDYCILPSVSEGLPLVALEAQAAGVPCLMSANISRNSDLGAGFFLPYDDLEAWTDTIIRGVRIDSQRLNEQLKEISVQAYAEKIRNIYEQK